MTELRNNAPRRYFIDGSGQRVLIGLTREETFEFERLEGQPAAELSDSQVTRDGSVLCRLAGEQRWHELYAKHEGAWKAWMVQSRTERLGSFSLY